MIYFHPYLDTELDAARKYPDSMAVDPKGTQQVYRRCAAGTDRPLFIPTLTNSYGKNTVFCILYCTSIRS
jgi:hypothetical protein